MLTRRRMLVTGGASAAVAFGNTPVLAQRLSDRAVTLVVPFSAGTGPDLLARTLGDELRNLWRQPFVVENKPGASGNIGAQAVARAEPDGHTLLVVPNTFVMNAGLFRNLPYDPQKSFAPIALLATGDVALTVHASVPARSVREFVELVKQRPGAMNYASPGVGTPQHLAMELFKLTTGIDIVHVPYGGAAGALKDLVGGHVSTMVLPVHTALPFATEGQIRILGVASPERSAAIPDFPTLGEQGVDVNVELWFGLLAPAGTSNEIVARYSRAINDVLAEPRVREALQKQGVKPMGGPPERLAALIAADQPRWTSVAEKAGLIRD